MCRISKISWFLLVVGLLCSWSAGASAQDIFKIDISKTAGKFSDWVQKQRENYQTVMEQISESQFATVIGDGIKSAQEGIKYAQDTYNAAMEKYEDIKNTVMDSPEYKAALLSQKIVEENTKLTSLQDEMILAVLTLRSTYDGEQEVQAEKIKQAQSNFEITAAAYAEELNQATDETRPKIEEKISDFQSGSEATLAAMEAEIGSIMQRYKAELTVLEADYNERIAEQKEKIAELNEDLKNLVADQFNTATAADADPAQSIGEMMKDLSLREDESISLQYLKDLEKRRNKKSTSAVAQSSTNAAGVITSTTDLDDEQQNSSAISETVNGKSESVQIAIEGMVDQMETLQKYLILELSAIEEETLKIITTSTLKTSEPKTVIDICDYVEEEDDKKIDLASSISQAEDTLNEIKDTADTVKAKGEEVKETVEQISSDPSSQGGDGAEDLMGGMF